MCSGRPCPITAVHHNRNPPLSEIASPSVSISDLEVNNTLNLLARELATAVANPETRMALHSAVNKRFDGDSNALWRTVSTSPDFVKAAAKSRGSSIFSEAERIPRLQVAIPEHFDTWNPQEFTPLVAVFPEGVDDTTIKTITAYDSAGNTLQLDAQVAPNQPVIVLNLNERVNDNGELIQPQFSTLPPSEEGSNTVLAAAAKYDVHMAVVELIDDKEPWAKGAAEISMKAMSRGCSGVDYSDTNWSGLDNSGDSWGPLSPRKLGSTTCDVVFSWWEDDGVEFDFTLQFNGFGLGVRMSDADDLIGGAQLSHASFSGSSMSETTWTALHQWTE